MTIDIRGLTYPSSIISTVHGNLILDPQLRGNVYHNGLLLTNSTAATLYSSCTTSPVHPPAAIDTDWRLGRARLARYSGSGRRLYAFRRRPSSSPMVGLRLHAPAVILPVVVSKQPGRHGRSVFLWTCGGRALDPIDYVSFQSTSDVVTSRDKVHTSDWATTTVPTPQYQAEAMPGGHFGHLGR